MTTDRPIQELRALAVLLAAAIAAREAAESLGITTSAEIIEDEGDLTLVVAPGRSADE